MKSSLYQRGKFFIFLFKDIRFWLILFFLVRMIGITNPPIETGHSWRQAFTCMVSRNLLEINANPLFPRTDMSGSNPNIVASEFPAFNYLIFLTARIFGYAHWYGRLINLIISTIGIYCFYLISKRFFDENVGFFASIILLLSVWFTFSRKIMPDTFSLSMVIIGIWFLIRYLDDNKLFYLLLFFIFATIGGLSKIPATVVLATATIAVLSKNHSLHKRIIILITIVFSVLLISWWYFIWEPHLLKTYHNQLYFPRSFRQGVTELIDMGFWTIDKFTFVALQSYAGLAAFLFGLFVAIRNHNKLLLGILSISSTLFIIYMIKTGSVFSNHTYYIIPFVPIMALFAGYGIAALPKIQIKYLLLIAIGIEALLNQQHDFRLKEGDLYKLKLEQIADQVMNREDLVGINGGLNPQLIYFLHRKGWSIADEQLNDQSFIKIIQSKGCKYLIVNRSTFQEFLPYELIYKDDNLLIYKL